MLSQIVAASSLFALAVSKTIPVSVGAFQNGTAGLVYDPNNIKADVGDLIQFTFHPKNHTVTQSGFANPCTILPPNATAGTSGGLDTGFKPVAATDTVLPVITVNVTDTKPLWFFCAQGNHCQSGMVMAVNAPATGNTFEAFLANAMGAAPGGGASAGAPAAGTPAAGGAGASSVSSAETGASTDAGSGAGSIRVGSTLLTTASLAVLVSLVA